MQAREEKEVTGYSRKTPSRAPHSHLKQEINNVLEIRGSREFAELDAYRAFTAEIADNGVGIVHPLELEVEPGIDHLAGTIGLVTKHMAQFLESGRALGIPFTEGGIAGTRRDIPADALGSAWLHLSLNCSSI